MPADRAGCCAQPWGGAEAPPPEELAAYWARELAWAEQQWSCDVEESGPPRDPFGDERPPDQHPGERVAMSSGWWAAADEAMEAVGEAMLTVDRALSRARGAVQRAELAEADDESAWQAGAAGRLTAAEDTISGLAALSAPRRAQLADLLDATGGGGLVDRPRIAVTDALTGALLALTDSRELRAAAAAGQGLGPPGPSGAYRPGAALDRYLRARDRRCRFPGCRNGVPVGGELDHNVPWPEGVTSAENLNGFCTSHHRGKHQAPGWEYELAPDGTLTVTTPSGVVATTSPPPY